MFRNVEYKLEDNLVIKGFKTNSESPDIICFHGWLDNSMSFSPLIHELGSDYSIESIDLIGHGLSSNLMKSIPSYSVPQAIYSLREYVEQKKKKVIIIGHSMGAGVASTFACVFPDLVKGLILLDILAPLPDETSVVKRLRNIHKFDVFPPRLHETIEEAIVSRMSSGVTREVAELLSKRSVIQNKEGKYHWRYDPRLKLSSLHKFTTSQVKDIASNIDCPVLHIYGDWKFRDIRKFYLDELIPRVSDIKVLKVSGDHYFHVTNIKEIKSEILKFFSVVL